jgi:hypothetical protein
MVRHGGWAALALLLAAGCGSRDDDGAAAAAAEAAPPPAPAPAPADSASHHLDIDDDGFDDIVVGAPANGGVGRVYGFLGSASPAVARSGGGADFAIDGEAAADLFGFAVANAGDVDGDGFDDLIVGAPGNDTAGADAGRAYLFFGFATPSGVFGAGSASILLTGETAGDEFGFSVDSAGDVNGDGFDDVVVGARGGDKAYVFFGGSGLPGAIGAAAADIVLTGEAGGDFFGISVSGGADVNGDGFDEVIVGASLAGNGKAYLFYGSTTPPAAIGAAAAGTIITGEVGFPALGVSVSTARDVNADGFGDVIVGAHAGGAATGKAYILLGSASPPAALGAGSAEVVVTGEAVGDFFGVSVSDAGDVNADGFDDVIMGADFDGTAIGKAYVLFGSGGLGGTIGAGDADVLMTGEGAGDNFGRRVSTVGDVNGDGADEVIVGAPFLAVAGEGKAYVDLGPPGGAFGAGAADITLTGEAVGDTFGAVR